MKTEEFVSEAFEQLTKERDELSIKLRLANDKIERVTNFKRQAESLNAELLEALKSIQSWYHIPAISRPAFPFEKLEAIAKAEGNLS